MRILVLLKLFGFFWVMECRTVSSEKSNRASSHSDGTPNIDWKNSLKDPTINKINKTNHQTMHPKENTFPKAVYPNYGRDFTFEEAQDRADEDLEEAVYKTSYDSEWDNQYDDSYQYNNDGTASQKDNRKKRSVSSKQLSSSYWEIDDEDLMGLSSGEEPGSGDTMPDEGSGAPLNHLFYQTVDQKLHKTMYKLDNRAPSGNEIIYIHSLEELNGSDKNNDDEDNRTNK